MLEVYGGESVCEDVSSTLGLAALDEFTVTGSYTNLTTK